MKLGGVVLGAVLLAACGSDHVRTCTRNDECVQEGESGRCTPSPLSDRDFCAYPDTDCSSGLRWGVLAGDGLADFCVDTSAYDAGPDADPNAPDAGDVDAEVPDAMPGPDARDPFENGQAADLVLGQPNFTSSTANNGGVSAVSMDHAYSVGSDGTRLWVADIGNSRVLQWNTLPTTMREPADIVLGQTTFDTVVAHTSTSSTFTQSFLPLTGIAVGGGHLIVTDPGGNRVLIWNAIPTANGQAASLVLGQTTFTSSSAGLSASKMNLPMAAWTDGAKLAVVDANNRRVLLWDTFPTLNGAAASRVLGAQSLTTMETGVSDATFAPTGVAFDGVQLFVSSSTDNRVLVWNGWPAVNGKAADFVIGQGNFDTSLPNAGGNISASTLLNPESVLSDGQYLYVTDSGNERVLIFELPITTSAPQARWVLGAPSLSAGENDVCSAEEMIQPYAIALANQFVWVADYSASRVLRFTTGR